MKTFNNKITLNLNGDAEINVKALIAPIEYTQYNFSVFRRGWVTQPLLITDIRQSYKPVSVLFKSSDNLVCRFDRSRTVCILIFRFSIV